jgi:hypothetical protein
LQRRKARDTQAREELLQFLNHRDQIPAYRLRTDEDNRLPYASHFRVEGGDSIVERCDGAYVRLRPSRTRWTISVN